MKAPTIGETIWSNLSPIGPAVVHDVDYLNGTDNRFLVYILHYDTEDAKMEQAPVQATWYKDVDFKQNFTRKVDTRYERLMDDEDDEEWRHCLDTEDDGWPS